MTSRYIENMLFNSFADEFFSRKQFMLTSFSIQALIDISKSRMAPRIRRLQFGLEQLKRECAFHPSDRVVQMYANQSQLWNSGAQDDMLAQALVNLHNLEDVVIRDFDSPTRMRDFPNATWRSYGYASAVALGAEFNNTRRGYGAIVAEMYDPASRTFASLLHALGKSGQQAKGLEIMFRQGNNLSDSSFDVPDFLQPTVLPYLQNLENLHLCVVLGRGTLTGEMSQSSGAQFLCRFLSYTPKLKNLRINGVRAFNPGMNRLMDHLADSTLPVDKHGRGLSLGCLEEFSLGMMEVEGPLLVRVLKNIAPSLRSLELWRVILRGNLDEEYLDNPKAAKPLWSTFCQDLLQVEQLNLRHVMLGCLEDGNGNRNLMGKGRVQFNGSEKATYTGPDWKRFVEDAIPGLKYEPRPDTTVHVPIVIDESSPDEDLSADSNDSEMDDDTSSSESGD